MKISYRQLSIMVFMSFVSVKLLGLPASLYERAGNMSWLVCIMLMIIDGLYAFLILGLMKKSGSKNIYEFLCDTVGVVLAKTFLVLFILKYLVVIAILGKGMEFFVAENLYDKMDWIVFAIPLMVVVGFMVYRGIRNIARVFELFFWIIVFSCLYIAFKSVSGVDTLAFLPMFEDGVMPLFDAGYVHLGWFGSSVFMFMLFGMVDFEKGKEKMWLYILGSILMVALMLFIFYGLFDNTSQIHQFCLSDISQFRSDKSSIAELSWLVVAVWIVAKLVMFAMYSYCLTQAIMLTFNIKSTTFGALFVYAYVLFWGYLNTKVIDPENWFFSPFVSIVTIITEYIIPLVVWAGVLIKRKKENKILPKGKNETAKLTNNKGVKA